MGGHWGSVRSGLGVELVLEAHGVLKELRIHRRVLPLPEEREVVDPFPWQEYRVAMERHGPLCAVSRSHWGDDGVKHPGLLRDATPGGVVHLSGPLHRLGHLQVGLGLGLG